MHRERERCTERERGRCTEREKGRCTERERDRERCTVCSTFEVGILRILHFGIVHSGMKNRNAYTRCICMCLGSVREQVFWVFVGYISLHKQRGVWKISGPNPLVRLLPGAVRPTDQRGQTIGIIAYGKREGKRGREY
eukprot:338909-Amorphochlora_amoeboformis.AAC.1